MSDMNHNSSQRHGIDFENLVKTTWPFRNATNMQRSGIAVFDIEAACDPVLNLATSVKTAGTETIYLADGPRFCAIDRPWRLIVGRWRQAGDIKSFYRVHEMIVPLGVMRRITGEMDEATAMRYHKEISSFAPGPEAAKAARHRAEQIQNETHRRRGILSLDFKIDDYTQRRLQFSIKIRDLVSILASEGDYVHKGVKHPLHRVHDTSFHQFVLPIRLLSQARVVKAGKAASDEIQADAPTLDVFDVAPTSEGDATAVNPPILKRDTPIRRDEARKRAAPVATDQTKLF